MHFVQYILPPVGAVWLLFQIFMRGAGQDLCILVVPPGPDHQWWRRFLQQTWCASPFSESTTPAFINLFLVHFFPKLHPDSRISLTHETREAPAEEKCCSNGILPSSFSTPPPSSKPTLCANYFCRKSVNFLKQRFWLWKWICCTMVKYHI